MTIYYIQNLRKFREMIIRIKCYIRNVAKIKLQKLSRVNITFSIRHYIDTMARVYKIFNAYKKKEKLKEICFFLFKKICEGEIMQLKFQNYISKNNSKCLG